MLIYFVLNTIVLVLCSDADRESRGLEDTGFGICHIKGMKPTNIRAEDIVEFSNQSENNSQISVQIFWSKLVENPLCVDVLTVSLGGQSMLIDNPADTDKVRFSIFL